MEDMSINYQLINQLSNFHSKNRLTEGDATRQKKTLI